MDVKIYTPKYMKDIPENNDIQKGDKITVSGSIPNKRSYKGNIAIPSEENVERAKEWVEYDKL